VPRLPAGPGNERARTGARGIASSAN
jgi:hypothetical protein